MIRAAALLVAASMLGGCITLLPEPPPPPRTYVLEARDVQESQGAPVNAVIGVAQPSGERSILSSDLIWRTGDTIAYVDQSQWSARASDSLQQVLAETLIRQGRFTSSTRSGEARADYEIRWEVLDFEVREDDMQAHFRAGQVRGVRIRNACRRERGTGHRAEGSVADIHPQKARSELDDDAG